MEKKLLKAVVTFRIEEESLEEIKSYARKESAEQNRDISYADIIRDLIRKKVEIIKKGRK